MAANSLLRRGVKRLLPIFLSERSYRLVQAAAMAWDIRTGNNVEPEVRLVPYAVKPGDTVLDIGANYGLYTYWLSRAVGKSGQVYAFEPIPFTKAVLESVGAILRLRNVEIVAKACGNSAGRAVFEVPLQPSGAIIAGLAHMRVDGRNRPQGTDRRPSGETQEVECEVIVLDDFLPPTQELSFIKCDIEGAELLAFQGAEETINRHRPTVLCEISRPLLERANIRLADLEEFFFSRTYGMYALDHTSGRLAAVADPGCVEGNYVFVHPSRRDRFATLFA